MDYLCQPGKATVVLGGQYGSEGKGAAAAWIATRPGVKFDIVTTNAGVQSGHTSIHEGRKRVLFHLPTAGVLSPSSVVYLNAGSVIRPEVLMRELDENKDMNVRDRLLIHPMATIVTDECMEAEGRANSVQTKIGSTRKGVGEAIARKALRSGVVARDYFKGSSLNVRRRDLNQALLCNESVMVEVPQGVSLSLNGKFYPYCTSRDCTVMQALSDAHIHPSFLGPTVLVLRTFPIRVGAIKDEEGNVLGESGSCYHDQREMTWEELGVEAEITTVTGRIRRVFTWSKAQVIDAMTLTRPTAVYLTFCDYVKDPRLKEQRIEDIYSVAKMLSLPITVVCQSGPTTADATVRV